jgi:TRAP-type C4-dicarboxylate transport system permease large subunit
LAERNRQIGNACPILALNDLRSVAAISSRYRGLRRSGGGLLPRCDPAIIFCAPILEPLAKAVSMDPVHFAMIGIVSLAFGLVTPPYGLCLLIACSVAGIRIHDAIKDTGIMPIPMLLVLALVIASPQASLLLPSLISPEFLR